jgi:hypothetical protein
MSKILLFDSWNLKFSGAIREHWESLGHEVKVNPQWDETGDIAFFYQGDNTAIDGVLKCPAPKKYVQVVDIEAWSNQPQTIDWSKVTGAIFMAQHIKDMVPTSCPSIIIKPGIDLTKFTLKTKVNKDPIRRIAYVVGDGRIWDVKRFDIALQMLYDLRQLQPQYIWQLHVRGTYSSHAQYNAYCKHLEEDLKLKDFVVWYPDRVEDMNKWLDDKHYFLLPSTKEAFSYATAEAMAKGIKPVINNWQSAKETWGQFVNNSYIEMLEKFTEAEYTPEIYRKYIEDNYNQVRYLKDLDEAILGVRQ